MDLSVEEKEALVSRGMAQYHQGNLGEAKNAFEQAKTVAAEKAAVPYYLGLIYLEENRRSDAIAEWQQYVLMEPDGEASLKIRKYLTLLLREEAVAYAKAALANEAALMSGPADDNTVAITSFSNLGSETLASLGKGLAAMLISDLTQVPDLQVVERIRLQALLQEMDLGASGVVDPETVPKVGKLLKSRHVATGSLADPEQKSLHLFSAVVDAEQADRVDIREAQGALEEFFTLEKQIACGIIEDIGRDCGDMPGAFNKIHTKSLAALTSFSIGLDYFDQGKFDEARAQFQKAIEEDPEFDLAKETLALTPLSAMLFLTGSQMVSSLTTSAASSTPLGAGAAGGGGGIGTGWLVAGGVAGAAAVAAAAGGGGGDDGNGGGNGDEPDPGPSADVDLTGDWTGSWSASGDGVGRILMSLTQTGTSVSGTAEVTGPGCTFGGNVSGTVEGSNFQATITGTGSATFNATCTATSMNGTLEATSGGCAGSSGSVSATITGSATIRW
jgi:tetratricopeptide (TPR) repeat protein